MNHLACAVKVNPQHSGQTKECSAADVLDAATESSAPIMRGHWSLRFYKRAARHEREL
jgi:hypothetical protein